MKTRQKAAVALSAGTLIAGGFAALPAQAASGSSQADAYMAAVPHARSSAATRSPTRTGRSVC